MAVSQKQIAEPAEDPDESLLIQRLRDGDESAYEEVVRTQGSRLFAAARRFLQNEQDAQDVVQEALLSAFKAIDRFAGQSRLATWLHRITVNAALMKLRSRKRSAERSIDELLPKFLEDGHRADVAGTWTVADDSAVLDRETREVVRKRIDELPESHRTVLLLRDIEERSTGETAELLGISPGAVKVRLHRARQALRTLLDPFMRGESR